MVMPLYDTLADQLNKLRVLQIVHNKRNAGVVVALRV